MMKSTRRHGESNKWLQLHADAISSTPPSADFPGTPMTSHKAGLGNLFKWQTTTVASNGYSSWHLMDEWRLAGWLTDWNWCSSAQHCNCQKVLQQNLKCSSVGRRRSLIVDFASESLKSGWGRGGGRRESFSMQTHCTFLHCNGHPATFSSSPPTPPQIELTFKWIWKFFFPVSSNLPADRDGLTLELFLRAASWLVDEVVVSRESICMASSLSLIWVLKTFFKLNIWKEKKRRRIGRALAMFSGMVGLTVKKIGLANSQALFSFA